MILDHILQVYPRFFLKSFEDKSPPDSRYNGQIKTTKSERILKWP